MKTIQQEKNYDILLCDVVSIPVIMSLTMDIPFIILNPLIVDMDSSPAHAEMLNPALQDEYVCYLIDQKVRKIAHPGWTYAKSCYYGFSSSDPQITLSSQDLFTASGKYPPYSDPKRTWYISNREFDIPFDETRLRTIKEVQANPRIYISFGTEMCNNYPMIDAFFEYFGNNDMDVLFTFGGNNFSYEMYKSRDWKNKNFKIELMVNQREVLASGKDIYFNHCGAGSIYEAIFYGVPMVCIPQEWDQPLNATTIAELGCGVVFPESHARGSVGKIQQSVETVLRDFDKIRQAALK
jgi:UDP:flavonoid glycosyltransferase YjiC (YdhE family)